MAGYDEAIKALEDRHKYFMKNNEEVYEYAEIICSFMEDKPMTQSIHSLSTIQLDRDAASRVVKDSGSYKAGNAIAQGKDDDHYIVRYFREQRIMLVNMMKEQKTA